MTNKPLILVTNDDGIDAPGITILKHIMLTIGDVVVVAPDGAKSGMGHAITVSKILKYKKLPSTISNLEEYSISGTPADCVKFALHELLDKTPDLCVSGINHGSNTSINVVYSGTMGAAIEAGINNIPAIGFSYYDFSWQADFSHIKPFVYKIAASVLTNGLPKDCVLNVNFPSEKTQPKGIKICRQSKGKWLERFDKRSNPHGQNYYWLSGHFENQDEGNDTDEWAVKNNFVAITPVLFDLTAHKHIDKLKKYKF